MAFKRYEVAITFFARVKMYRLQYVIKTWSNWKILAYNDHTSIWDYVMPYYVKKKAEKNLNMR